VSTENNLLDQPSAVPSRTQRKREAERLQKIGRAMAALNQDQLVALDLPARLLSAIADYQRFPSREAKRRQLQYVGKIMRNVDTDAIEEHLAGLVGESAQARYQFHQLEQWRDELITDPQALTRFISTCPNVDIQKLRQLIKKVSSTQQSEQRKINARTLFRFLRDNMESLDRSG
jgi:ribosome-associated protein